ncbi:MAG: DNRLRE domain-containing protein [Puniceicoccaceae bacterium]
MKPITLAVLVAFAATPLLGQIVLTTEAGDGADAYIFDRFPTTNYGLDTTAAVKNDNVNYRRKAYFRFDLSGLTGTASSASLTFHDFADGIGNNLNLYMLNQGNAGENWGETTITWSNAPANITSSPSGLSAGEVTFLSSLTTDGFNRWAELTYSPSVTTVFTGLESAINTALSDTGDNYLTFIVTASSSNTSYAWSAFTKEHNSLAAPYLSINGITAVPEPATYAAIAFGVLGLAIFNRRRKRST